MTDNIYYKNINQDSKYLNLCNIELKTKNYIHIGYNSLDKKDLDAVSNFKKNKNLNIIKHKLGKYKKHALYLVICLKKIY